MHYLITWFGRLVCYDTERKLLVQRDPLAIHPAAVPVCLDPADGRLAYGLDGDNPRDVGKAACGKVGHGHPDDPLVPEITGQPGRIVQMASEGMYFSAGPDQSVSASRRQADAWEQFFLASEQDLCDLRHLMSHAWIRRSSQAIVAREQIALLEGFRLRFGEQTVRLDENFPMEFAERQSVVAPFASDRGGRRLRHFFSTVLFSDAWRIEEIFLYRPLVYQVAFGEPETFECLRVSLESLSEFARFGGEVLIITDKDWSHVKWVVPDVLRDRTYIWKTNAGDFVEYCMLRWRACEWPKFHEFQPLLYVDTDVVFDNDLNPLLASLAMSRSIAAAREDYSPLATAEPVGARLFEGEGLSLDGETGFNSGAIGIPNATRCGRDCRLMIGTMSRFLQARADGKSISWFDQALANYASRKAASFDLDLLSRHHQFDYPPGRADPAHPLGLVHLWGGGLDHKLKRMTEYLRARRGAPEGTNSP